MTRPSTRAVRRAATDLPEKVTPHLSTAKEALVGEVLPKVMSTGAELLPKAKAAGVGVAVKAGLMEAPKKRHPLRMAVIAGALTVGAFAAWKAWRLPHASDDWTHAQTSADQAPTDSPTEAEVPNVPADATGVAG